MRVRVEGGPFPTPRAWIKGYGRAQVLSFICRACGGEHFDGKGDQAVSRILCDECASKDGEIVVQGQGLNLIEIAGYKVMSDARNSRSRFNYRKVLNRDGFVCRYCGYDPRIYRKFLALHVDHVLPHAYGGNNSMENLVTACEECNSAVGSLIFQSFIDKRIWITEWREKRGLPIGRRQWLEYNAG